MVDGQQSTSPDERLNDKAWKAQSESLVEVQKRGGDLEDEVAHVLGWGGGKTVYDFKHRYTLQIDAAYPSIKSPNIVVSVTYTNPDKRGHSNEIPVADFTEIRSGRTYRLLRPIFLVDIFS